MIRDRGKIKWQPAHFLPEQVTLLKKLHIDANKQRKPQLDEQEYEAIGIIVMESLNYTLPVKITIWQNGDFKDHIGIVDKVDLLMKYLILHTNEEKLYILIDEITAVERK